MPGKKGNGRPSPDRRRKVTPMLSTGGQLPASTDWLQNLTSGDLNLLEPTCLMLTASLNRELPSSSLNVDALMKNTDLLDGLSTPWETKCMKRLTGDELRRKVVVLQPLAAYVTIVSRSAESFPFLREEVLKCMVASIDQCFLNLKTRDTISPTTQESYLRCMYEFFTLCHETQPELMKRLASSKITLEGQPPMFSKESLAAATWRAIGNEELQLTAGTKSIMLRFGVCVCKLGPEQVNEVLPSLDPLAITSQQCQVLTSAIVDVSNQTENLLEKIGNLEIGVGYAAELYCALRPLFPDDDRIFEAPVVKQMQEAALRCVLRLDETTGGLRILDEIHHILITQLDNLGTDGSDNEILRNILEWMESFQVSLIKLTSEGRGSGLVWITTFWLDHLFIPSLEGLLVSLSSVEVVAKLPEHERAILAANAFNWFDSPLEADQWPDSLNPKDMVQVLRVFCRMCHFMTFSLENRQVAKPFCSVAISALEFFAHILAPAAPFEDDVADLRAVIQDCVKPYLLTRLSRAPYSQLPEIEMGFARSLVRFLALLGVKTKALPLKRSCIEPLVGMLGEAIQDGQNFGLARYGPEILTEVAVGIVANFEDPAYDHLGNEVGLDSVAKQASVLALGPSLGSVASSFQEGYEVYVNGFEALGSWE